MYTSIYCSSIKDIRFGRHGCVAAASQLCTLVITTISPEKFPVFAPNATYDIFSLASVNFVALGARATKSVRSVYAKLVTAARFLVQRSQLSRE